MMTKKRTEQAFSLLLLFGILLTTGCQHQDTVVATYSGAPSGASEKISLLSTGKYSQTLTYHQRTFGIGLLLGKPFDVPFTLYAKGTWALVDSSTGLPVSASEAAGDNWQHTDVALKSAVGPAPFEEGNIKYTYLDRRIPARAFRLTQKAVPTQH